MPKEKDYTPQGDIGDLAFLLYLWKGFEYYAEAVDWFGRQASRTIKYFRREKQNS